MRGPRDIAGKLFEEGTRLLSGAAGAVMKDPRGQEALARAVGIAQRGKKRLDAIQEQLLHTVGLAARPDYAEIQKQLARLKRKAREVAEKLDGSKRSG